MATIHSKDIKSEMVVKRYLSSPRFRYRLNHPIVWQAGHSAAEIPNLYLRERMFLAWT